MAYYIQPVERDLLPAGSDWAFLELDGGDICFVVAKDAERVELPDCALRSLLKKIAQHTQVAQVVDDPDSRRALFQVV